MSSTVDHSDASANPASSHSSNEVAAHMDGSRKTTSSLEDCDDDDDADEDSSSPNVANFSSMLFFCFIVVVVDEYTTEEEEGWIPDISLSPLCLFKAYSAYVTRFQLFHQQTEERVESHKANCP